MKAGAYISQFRGRGHDSPAISAEAVAFDLTGLRQPRLVLVLLVLVPVRLNKGWMRGEELEMIDNHLHCTLFWSGIIWLTGVLIRLAPYLQRHLSPVCSPVCFHLKRRKVNRDNLNRMCLGNLKNGCAHQLRVNTTSQSKFR